MTSHPVTWMFDLSPFTLTTNAMLPRIPTTMMTRMKQTKRTATRRTSLPSSENPTKTNSAAGEQQVQRLTWRREPWSPQAALTSVLAKAAPGARFNEHLSS